MLQGLAAIVIGYLLGSFPTAYIVAKLRKGIDIRDVDVHNMGAGAVIRQVGRRAGAAVAITDIAKGSASVLVAQALGVSEPWVLGAAFAAVVGHNLPLYVGFRGGQGAATLIGIFLVLSPLATAVCFAIMAVALYRTRQIFSILVIAAPFLPLFIWLFDGSLMIIIFSLVFIAALYYRNHSSLKQVWVRIIRGGKIEYDMYSH